METGLRNFFTDIYKWMVAGLILSGLAAWLTVNSPLVVFLQNPVLFWGTVAVEIALLFIIQWGINRLSYQHSFVLYFVYAILNGITISGLLLYYLTKSPSLVLIIFGVAASMFVLLAMLSYHTKRDLSSWGTFLIAGVWGVFIASIINIFLQNSMFDLFISAVALIVFAGLTVYDNQFYKNLYAQLPNEEAVSYTHLTLPTILLV